MDINSLQATEFANLFPETASNLPKKPNFGSGLETDQDLFPKKVDDKLPDAVSAATGDNPPPTDAPQPPATGVEPPATTNADILGDGDDGKKGGGRKPKYDFSDASGYFEDRFKSGKLISIEEQGDDGTKKPFVPKTPEEFDEVIDMQVDYRLGQERKNIEQKLYQSKSPAWQAVLKYAELVNDPTEIIPFLKGARTLGSISEIDETTVEGAEQIIRTRLEQRGDTQELIDEQIETLKSTDKIVNTAKQYKPLILQEEQRNLTQMARQREVEQQEYKTFVEEIEKKAVQAIETPIFGGKQKLKRDEQAIIYDMIALPSEETKGYGIYHAIDDLFQKGNFEKLAKVALLLGKEDSFLSYISTGASDKTAASLQRKLVIGADKNSSGRQDDTYDDNRPVMQRHKYTGKFGR